MKKLKALAALCLALVLAGCAGSQPLTQAEPSKAPPQWDSLQKTGDVALEYAEEFSAQNYEGGYTLLQIGSTEYLLCPKSESVPEGMPEDVTVIKTPIEKAYLAATSAMDFFITLDGLGSIAYSGTKADGWYLPEAKDAMEQGQIAFAGKYSAPDYEQLLQGGCDVSIESTMILHSPDTKEQLERLGIPVLVERSSYESDPLGRMEWIKLYGLLLNKLPEAEGIFAEKLTEIEPVLSQPAAGGTVAFFYITSNGAVNVRRHSDYIARMIGMAGGTYLAPEDGEENARSTMTIQMEQFYESAKNAEYLIYNSTIDGEIHKISELLQKDAVLQDFDAVKAGRVYCTGKNFFQETMSMADFLLDVHTMLTDPDFTSGTYLYKLEDS